MINTWDQLQQASQNTQSTPGDLTFTPQYNSQGYQANYAYNPGANPWDSILSQGQNMAGQDQQLSQNQMNLSQQNLQSQMQQASQFGSQYPSYPNAAGAGNQQAGQMQAPPMEGAGSQGLGSTQYPDPTSRGFNPWSLTGEAMSRK